MTSGLSLDLGNLTTHHFDGDRELQLAASRNLLVFRRLGCSTRTEQRCRAVRSQAFLDLARRDDYRRYPKRQKYFAEGRRGRRPDGILIMGKALDFRPMLSFRRSRRDQNPRARRSRRIAETIDRSALTFENKNSLTRMLDGRAVALPATTS